jgi:hypothetical protein
MPKQIQLGLIAVLALFAVSVPLFAHHGNAAYANKEVTMKGTVVQWLWTNPHTFLKFDVKDDKGNLVHWTGEWNAPSTLVNFGFSPKTFKPGDEVTVTLSGTSKDGTLVGRLKSVVLPDGTIMSEDERFGRAPDSH